MDKLRKIALAFFVTTLALSPLAFFGKESPKQILALSESQPITSSSLTGVEWVKQCLAQYPEIAWLADANVRKTEEGRASAQSPYSEQLFGARYIEFDRTIMTLHCLRLILKGGDLAYEEFTKAQPQEERLSRASFDALHAEALALLHSGYRGISPLEMTRAMEASLVLGDVGKSEAARTFFKPYGAKMPDHDDFHGEVLLILQKKPSLSPTFNRLSPAAQKLLIETRDLAHYGHITHLEGGPLMFAKLKESGADPIALRFDLLVHQCDVAGAFGHVNKDSSLAYKESAHLAMVGVSEACKILADPEATEHDAYDAYLTVRAGYLGLDPQDPVDRALTRVGAMLRLFTPQDGLLLRQAIGKLDPRTQSKVIVALNLPEIEELGRTPTYMPAVLINLASHPDLGSSREERLSSAITLGLPFLAKVLQYHREELIAGHLDPEVPLNFNKAAGTAKANPDALAGGYAIDAEGNVHPDGMMHSPK